MHPQPVIPEQPIQPRGPWLWRGLRALLIERRLPTRVADGIDRACLALGMPYKTVAMEGFRIRVRRLTPDIHFARDGLVHQRYTPPGFEIGSSDTVIDVGGNVGGFALLAARHAHQGRVLTFEPVSDNFRILQHNLERNRVKNVTAVRAAVLDRPSTVRVYLSQESTGTHTAVESLAPDTTRYEEVQSLTLPHIFEQYGIDRCHFLKLNCEGAEFPILLNLSPEMFRRIDAIVLQYHGTSAQTKADEAQRLIDILQREGFRIDLYSDVVGTEGGFIGAKRPPTR